MSSTRRASPDQVFLFGHADGCLGIRVSYQNQEPHQRMKFSSGSALPLMGTYTNGVVDICTNARHCDLHMFRILLTIQSWREGGLERTHVRVSPKKTMTERLQVYNLMRVFSAGGVSRAKYVEVPMGDLMSREMNCPPGYEWLAGATRLWRRNGSGNAPDPSVFFSQGIQYCVNQAEQDLEGEPLPRSVRPFSGMS
ncbi:hypothetical protein BD414DRAFT_286659 [Trametes punicea]|nr:hypothetical protein BD414DRAFT_286659 [Trametes punicea]